MKWKDKLLEQLIVNLKHDENWKSYAAKIEQTVPLIGIHLAIFTEPILTALLAGAKTVESRFSMNKVQPFGKVRKGDIIMVKKSGGPVVAVFISGEIISFSNLTPDKIDQIRTKYSPTLGLSENDAFWRDKKDAKYATIINIKTIKLLQPCRIEKRDRTGWVILTERKTGTLL